MMVWKYSPPRRKKKRYVTPKERAGTAQKWMDRRLASSDRRLDKMTKEIHGKIMETPDPELKEPITSRIPVLPGEAPLRDIEKWLVLFDKRRGLSELRIAKRWHLKTSQVRYIIGHTDFRDLKVGVEVTEYIARLNASMLSLQGDILESITQEEISKASLTQRSILFGILADKTKAYDAHISGTKDTTVQVVAPLDKNELEEKIKRLVERNRDVIDADLGREIEDAEFSEIDEVKELPESNQLDLFTQPENEKREPEVMELKNRRSVNSRLGHGIITTTERVRGRGGY